MAWPVEKQSVQTTPLTSLTDHQDDDMLNSAGITTTVGFNNQSTVSTSHDGDDAHSERFIIWGIVGGVAIIFVLLLTASLIIYLFKRRQRTENRAETDSRRGLSGGFITEGSERESLCRCCPCYPCCCLCCCLCCHLCCRCCCRCRCCLCCCCCRSQGDGRLDVSVKGLTNEENVDAAEDAEAPNSGQTSARVLHNPDPDSVHERQPTPESQFTERQETSQVSQVPVPQQASADSGNPAGEYIELAHIEATGHHQPGDDGVSEDDGACGGAAVGSAAQGFRGASPEFRSIPDPLSITSSSPRLRSTSLTDSKHPASDVSNSENRPRSLSSPPSSGVSYVGNPLSPDSPMQHSGVAQSPKRERNFPMPSDTPSNPLGYHQDLESREESQTRSEGEALGQGDVGPFNIYRNPAADIGTPTMADPFGNLMPFSPPHLQRKRQETSSQSPQQSFSKHSESPGRSSGSDPSSLSDAELQAAGYAVGETKPASKRQQKEEEPTHVMWCPQHQRSQESDDARRRPGLRTAQPVIPFSQNVTFDTRSSTPTETSDELYHLCNMNPPTHPDDLENLTPSEDELNSDYEDSCDRQDAYDLGPSRNASGPQAFPSLSPPPPLLDSCQRNLLTPHGLSQRHVHFEAPSNLQRSNWSSRTMPIRMTRAEMPLLSDTHASSFDHPASHQVHSPASSTLLDSVHGAGAAPSPRSWPSRRPPHDHMWKQLPQDERGAAGGGGGGGGGGGAHGNPRRNPRPQVPGNWGVDPRQPRRH